jgi:hypothetical protein
MLKSYLKYKYQLVLIELKLVKKEAFLKAILEGNLEHLHVLCLLKKSGYCFFYSKKSIKEAFKEQNLIQSSF